MKNSKGKPVGRIHSLETLAALDGPGIRTAVFLQGCPLRCKYCHNPDMFSADGGEEFTPKELADKLSRYKTYYGKEGGVTFSGGEPLLQAEFILEFMKTAKDIKVAIDTSGYVLNSIIKQILDICQLVILDIKHTDQRAFKELTGVEMVHTLEFLEYCKNKKIPLLVRQVIVPGINDTKEQVINLARLIKGCNIQKAELLPYHTMGVFKWKNLGLVYQLADTPAADPAKLEELQKVLEEEIRN